MPAAARKSIDEILDQVEWRSIGPFRGGRCVAVSGDPMNRQVFYMGSTGGGVWKTDDGGIIWQNVSDKFFRRASVGAIAVAPSDPNVVYVGMGEACIRGNVSHGDGVYRSTDAGKTWTHLGLAATRNVGKVRVHPHDADTVFVAALGHAHGPNRDRGLYRSRDGGVTWQKILSRGEKAGAIDLSIDPNNPRIMYCTFWEANRTFWQLTSGGPGSGIFRSSDGGDTWTDISRNQGLPKGILGKIGIAVSPAKSGRVYAVVEAEDGAVFRSDDGGEKWERLSEDRNLRQRAWYYHHVVADPQDPETVWVLNVECWRSIDGGKTFTQVTVPHGDNHDLWIDPKDPKRMIEGNDGGATVSFNGGESWSSLYNQPTAEFYHVSTDTRRPYRVYGAQQDNSTITVPSRSMIAGITNREAYAIGGGESGYIAVRPDDPDIVYAGNYQGYMTRYDHRTGQARNIEVWPEASAGYGAKDTKYRFRWTFPIVLSPHDPNVLYATGNHVFRSTDEGRTWQRISPDLTRNDKKKQEASGGPITKDNTGAEYYCTVFAFAESPVRRGVLWAGSDDGLVHVSRNNGKTWRNVTPEAIPPFTLVSIIEASPHDPAVAYAAATRYALDDFHPMLFVTGDYGGTWKPITNGIPADDFTRAIREDPEVRGLLYCGTETGVYVSFNDGGRWHRLKGNLPAVPIHDLVVKDGDLVLGTHGRSFWVFDDLSPLRQRFERAVSGGPYLFTPRKTTRFQTDRGFGAKPKPGKNYRQPGATMVTWIPFEKPTGEKGEIFLDAGKNPPDGVLLRYFLPTQPKQEITLSIHDARGKAIKTFTSKKPPEPKPDGAPVQTDEEEEDLKEPRLPKEAGINRFVWTTRYANATKVVGDTSMEEAERALAGPLAPPGTYEARLKVGRETVSAKFEIESDPRTGVSRDDLVKQFELLLKLRDNLSETHDAVNTIRNLRTQVEEWEKRVRGRPEQRQVARAAAPLKRGLDAIEEALIQRKAKSRQDTLNFPIKLNAKIGGLVVRVSQADGAPPKSAEQLAADLAKRAEAQLAKLRQLTSRQLPAFERQIKLARVPGITVRGRGAPAAGTAGRR